MSSIDQRVVEMKFNATAFSKGIADTISALQKLQAALKLEGSTKGAIDAAKGIDDLSHKTGLFNGKLADMAKGVQTATTGVLGLGSQAATAGGKFGDINKGASQATAGVNELGRQAGFLGGQFTAMQAVAFGALASVGAKALQIGTMVGSALTIDPVTTGLSEYETNLNSIQTILANTQVAGTTLADVNAALEELNHYSDQTIYNFAEMAKNIGTFTAAGVDLDRSVASIKGIANLAAFSGSNSEKAAGAMYQLSQEIAAGRVSLMGWNSVVNAGMGGTTFQRALATTAVAMGAIDESAVRLEGDMQNVIISGKSFRDSIDATNGPSWLTSDVLTSTLAQFTGDLTDAELAAQGFTDAQVKSIQMTAQTAKNAATQVKTLSGVFSTAKEVAGSGWAKTWQLIFGDFEEAKRDFTAFSLFVNGFLERMAKRRNEVLAEWKIGGGREVLIEGLKNASTALLAVLRPIGEAFRSIFPATTSKDLLTATERFRDLMKSLIPGERTIENLRRTFAGVFAILGIGWELIKAGAEFFARLFGTITEGGGSVLAFTGNVGDFLVALLDAIKTGDLFGKMFDGIADFIEAPINAIKALIGWFGELFGLADDEASTKSVDGLATAIENLGDLVNRVGDAWAAIGDWFAKLWEKAQPGIEVIKTGVENLIESIGERLSQVDFGDILAAIATGSVATALLSLKQLFETIKEGLSGIFGGEDGGPGFLQGLVDALEELTETLQAMQNALNAHALLAIAGAVALLAYTLGELADIDTDDLTKATIAVGVLVGILVTAGKLLGGAELPTIASMISMGIGLLLISFAVKKLAEAVVLLKDVKWDDILKGLVAVLGLVTMLVGVVKLLQNNEAKLLRTAAGLLVLSYAVKELADAVEQMSDIDWAELGRGLTGVGGLLLSLGLFARFANVGNVGIRNGAGIILIAVGINMLVDAVKDASKLDWDKLSRGLAVVSGGLVAIGVALRLIPRRSLFNAVGVLIVAASLSLVAEAMEDIGNMNWQEIQQGLTGIAAALTGIAIALRIIPRGAIFSAAAIYIVVLAMKGIAEVLEDISKMDWSEIGRAMTALGGAMAIIGVAMTLMKSSILGAASLFIAAVAIKVIASAMEDLGAMDWADIGAAVVILAASLALIGFAIAALSVPIFLLGALALIMAAGAIAILTPALERLGAMSWSDIGAAIGGLGLLFAVLAAGGVASPLIGALGAALLLVAGAIAIVGVAIQNAGEGVSTFVDAMVRLSEIDDAAMDQVVANIEKLIDLAPNLGEALGDAISEFIITLGEKTPEMAAAMGEAVSASARETAKRMPEVTAAHLQGLTNTYAAIDDKLPELISKGADAVVKFLTGIAREVPRVSRAGADLVISFLVAMGVEIPRVVEAGFQMIVAVMNGIAESIRRNAPQIKAAAANIGSAIIEGIIGGVEGGQGSLNSKMNTLAKGALFAAKIALGINSPSRVFRDVVGMAIPEGIAVGIDKYGYLANNAVVTMGDGLLDTMGKSISGLGKLIDAGMDDLTPVITPVLDLSAVQAGSAKIGDLLSATPIDLRDAMANASDASAGYSANLEALAEAVAGSSSTVSMTQNNYSPKALSQADIYRQTNNQISQAKGALTNAN